MVMGPWLNPVGLRFPHEVNDTPAAATTLELPPSSLRLFRLPMSSRPNSTSAGRPLPAGLPATLSIAIIP
ncbi:hypothetical protein OPV22_008075 [Ensete ventricosum]|uniref:Uncharacterized protein n=1 Tax=Ensete ventricosum TaxID=4639 RepID=A0AAV8RCN3_ENSVE|nr:hypothetical protein OPV22_008075 [Ensete ventricosum]